jgi:hypothetical protein
MQNMAPALIPEDVSVDNWLTAENDSLEFKTTIAYPYNLQVKPFFMNKGRPYSVYWQKMNRAEWKSRLLKEKKLEQKLKNIDLATIDRIVVGDDKSDEQHRLSGNSFMAKGNKGIYNDLYWRVATDSVGFGYKLRTDANENTKIKVSFLGPAHYEKWDCLIKVNGVVLDTLYREEGASSPSNIVLTYPLSDVPTSNNDSISVWFNVKDGWKMPRLFEIRTIKD